jgi:putative effector of murein hydrolase
MLIEEIRNVPINEVTITTVISDICLLFHSIPYPNLHEGSKIIQMLSVGNPLN